eukprot:TRINITY_DN12075_c0_g2_i1.p1 TRINITY_DN12075_c0_g2~~TRINITY_DN12075_c0_g2_i1.p1  ORF type:complete len:444 (+),score=108.16 TRINITY_DN12075_c0_g2_i1:228-1559(+)
MMKDVSTGEAGAVPAARRPSLVMLAEEKTNFQANMVDRLFKFILGIVAATTIVYICIMGVYDHGSWCMLFLFKGACVSYATAKLAKSPILGGHIFLAYALVLECLLSVLLEEKCIRMWLSAIPLVIGMLTLSTTPRPLLVWLGITSTVTAFFYLVIDVNLKLEALQQLQQHDESVHISLRNIRHRAFFEYFVFEIFYIAMTVITYMNWLLVKSYKSQVDDAMDKLVQSRDAAEAGVRAKQDFLATMSHEIRTPLHGLLGMAQVLARSKMTRGQRESLTIIQHCGDLLLNLINNVLDLSRMEAGLLSIEMRAINVRFVVQRVVDVLGAMATKKQIVLQYHVDPNVPSVITGDPDRIMQILLNMAANAVKFTSVGHVRIAVSLEVRNPSNRHTSGSDLHTSSSSTSSASSSSFSSPSPRSSTSSLLSPTPPSSRSSSTSSLIPGP